MYKVINTTMNEMQKRNEVPNINNETWTDNDIGAEGATKISESLTINTTLTTLYLDGGDDNIIKNKQE